MACKRVIDDIPMHLITTLVEPLGPQLRAAARPTDEDLRRLLAETRESTSARQRATDQFLAMEAAEEGPPKCHGLGGIWQPPDPEAALRVGGHEGRKPDSGCSDDVSGGDLITAGMGSTE